MTLLRMPSLKKLGRAVLDVLAEETVPVHPYAHGYQKVLDWDASLKGWNPFVLWAVLRHFRKHKIWLPDVAEATTASKIYEKYTSHHDRQSFIQGMRTGLLSLSASGLSRHGDLGYRMYCGACHWYFRRVCGVFKDHIMLRWNGGNYMVVGVGKWPLVLAGRTRRGTVLGDPPDVALYEGLDPVLGVMGGVLVKR